MKGYGYIRVSTDDQAKEGVSLESQEAKIRAWCAASGVDLAAVFVETMSGGRADNRPQLQAALAAVCQARGVLIVYSLSRLARSTTDAIGISQRLEKSGADLASLTERIDTTSAAGKMVFRMLAVLAEFERDQIKERTMAAMSHLRRKGVRISGKVPFGYDLAPDGSWLLPNESEQAGLRLIAKMHNERMSLRQIGQTLDREGISPKQGGRWDHSAVRKILARMRKLNTQAAA